MPRRRPPPSAICIAAGALATVAAACQLFGSSAAKAQTANAGGGANSQLESELMRPVLDGDPQNPPRFRNSRRTMDNAPTRFGQRPNFSYQPALGAGTTGFDSRGTRKVKPRPAAVGAQPQGNAGAPADVAATPGAVPFTPKQLQPPTGTVPPRYRLQNRPGAPPTDIDAAAWTLATIPPSRRPLIEDKPFDPLGIQVGAFNFRPAFEYSRGFSNNPAYNATAPTQSSWYNVYAPELLVNSNWDRHELTASLRGTYTTYDTMHQLDRPTAEAKVDGRVDVTSQSRIDLEGRYLLFTDFLGSPNIQAGLSHLPIGQDYGTTVGVGQRFNRLDVSLKGTYDRIVYNDSEFLDGSTSSNAGRNYNKYGAVLRTTYDVMPGAAPFVEIGTDERHYDLEVDLGGNHRSSEGYYGKAGTTLAFAGKLTGEVSVGYLTRQYHDANLPSIYGWTVDSALIWLATPLTTVKLINTTTVTESTVTNVSGAFTRETTLQVDHAFRRWLLATVKLTRGFDDYVGDDREDIRYIASAALSYNLSREFWLKGEYRQEWRTSNQPGNNYWAHVYLLTLRMQR